MERPARLVVIGSSNMDLVVRASRVPQPGETLLGGAFLANPGGKGANQAVAAARLGAQVTFVACLGQDSFGDQAVAGFVTDGIDVSHVHRTAKVASGVALITVADDGENAIVVAPGANACLTPAHVDAAQVAIAAADALLLQFETPLPTVLHAARLARRLGVPVILNPAPVPDAGSAGDSRSLSGLLAELMSLVDVLTPNEGEARALLTNAAAGSDASPAPATDEPAALAATLLRLGVGRVVMTLGARGAWLAESVGAPGMAGSARAPRAVHGRHLAASPVRAVDTTGAGDCFNGALVVALAEGASLDAAAAFACRCAGLAVTRPGAQCAMPRRAELDIAP